MSCDKSERADVSFSFSFYLSSPSYISRFLGFRICYSTHLHWMAPLSSSPTLTLVNLTCTSLHLRHPFASSSLPLAAGSTISAAHHATVDDHGLLYILAEATSTNGFKGKHRSLDSFSTANEDEIPVQLKLGRCEARTLLFETSEEAPFRVWQQVRFGMDAKRSRRRAN